ncbi:Lysophospholipid acyltransferase [Escovopsis weberi]|uniref:Lysophospholipid acyltransferase n=1 Tax=Escovopsis weberi TaxID=150374 RepID=A0A0M9VRN9_ESCWE|nr:Lysophospholipid acyltransferase [Escovopsis weberi]
MNTNNWLRNYIYLRVTPRGKKPGFRASMVTFVTNYRRHVRPLFLDPISGNALPRKKYYDLASLLATQLVFSFVTLPFLILSLDSSLRAWSQVHFYGFVATVASIVVFASPAKTILIKQLKQRLGRANAKTSQSFSSDGANGKEPVLGISTDPQQDINEAVDKFKAELEALQGTRNRKSGSVGNGSKD